MYDLVIRGGDVVDGTGTPLQPGTDVAITGETIAAVGRDLGRGRREIDATGQLVTPGFVDIHTHYDGQASWDPLMTPSSGHGVTTVVMGNCGVGFAPVAPTRRTWLIELMEAVEDIPGAALAEGIRWNWETFPEYLDALDAMPRVVDVAAQVPHAALRAYVMGDRAAGDAPASTDDVARMVEITREAVAAGALGFSTSRTMLHRSHGDVPIPGSYAGADELAALAAAVVAGGPGAVFQVATDAAMGKLDGRFGHDIKTLSAIAANTGVRVGYSLLQNDGAPQQWRDVLAQAGGGGGALTAMVAGRPTGMLLGLESSMHPFKAHPTYERIAGLPLAERVAELRRPEVKAAILGEASGYTGQFLRQVAHGFHKMYPLGSVPDYEPAPQDCLAERARRGGRDPYELCYETLLEMDGRALLFFPLTDYADHNLDATWERLQRDDCVLSLSDGGAHCRLICDASMPTFMLSFWARDRHRGPTISVERAVQLQTSSTAAFYGMTDRGVLGAGRRADVNVIDFDALRLHNPTMVYDLPSGAPRLVQGADGYVATIAGGVPTFESGEHTGALPGRLVRRGAAART